MTPVAIGIDLEEANQSPAGPHKDTVRVEKLIVVDLSEFARAFWGEQLCKLVEVFVVVGEVLAVWIPSCNQRKICI